MSTRRVVPGLLTLVALALSSRTAPAQQGVPPDSAEEWFVAGQFARAKQAFRTRWADDSTDYSAAARLGLIALLGNRLDDAERWLSRAIALRPDSVRQHAQLAEALYRSDRFADAVAHLRAARQASRATKLESFAGQTPYDISGAREMTYLPFVITDPLPMVRVGINGPDTLFFLIDTGGGELIVDDSVARAAGAVEFSRSQGTFAGGVAPVGDGRVDLVRLGEFTVRNVPVRIMNVRQTGAAVGGQRVDGIIGTVMLYHFLATIDYPGGSLILRRRTAAQLQQVEREAAARGAAAMPFWLAGDHFMFAWGQVNGRSPVLLFVDTGLAGGGFLCSEAAARDYGIDLTKAPASEGVGGAGRTRVTWFTADSLTMGTMTSRNLRGAVGTLRFRDSFGFEAGGIVSHQFFRPYALTLDFERMRLFLTPP